MVQELHEKLVAKTEENDQMAAEFDLEMQKLKQASDLGQAELSTQSARKLLDLEAKLKEKAAEYLFLFFFSIVVYLVLIRTRQLQEKAKREAVEGELEKEKRKYSLLAQELEEEQVNIKKSFSLLYVYF